MLVKCKQQYENPIITESQQYDYYYAHRLVGIANYGKLIPIGDTIVLSIRGVIGEEKKTQLVSVIVGVKPNPKSPTSELKVYVHSDVTLDEELLKLKGFVTITTGTVDGGQLTIPILVTGILDIEGSAHIGITPWLERTVEGRNPRKPGVKGCTNCAYKGDGTLENITCNINSPRIAVTEANDTKYNLELLHLLPKPKLQLISACRTRSILYIIQF